MAFGGAIGFGLAITAENLFSGPVNTARASFNNFTAAVTRGSDKVNTSLKTTTDSSGRLRDELGRFVAGPAQKLEQSLNRIQQGFLGVVSSMVVIAPFASAVSVFAEFDAKISEVGAKANATGSQLETLRQQALDLGDTTAFSAKQVAEAQVFLAQAGFRVEDIYGSLPGTLSLAAAGNIDLAKSADIASNVLSQFRLEAEDMGRVADVLSKTITSSNVNMSQLAESMKYLGPTAAALGVSIEESSAAIGLLGNAGLQGSVATQALGTALVRFSKPTREMQRVMQQTGFTAFDTAGNFVGLADVVGNLQKATKGMTQEQKTSTIATLFGAEAIQEIMTLLSAQQKVMVDGKEVTLEGADALRYFTEQLESSAGAADALARKQLDNLKGDFTLLSSATETLAITFGGVLAPILRVAVQNFTILVQSVKSFIQTDLGKYLTIAAAAAGAFVVAVVAVNYAVTGLIQGFLSLAASTIAALAPIWPFVALAAVLAAGFILVNESLSAFTALLDGTEKPASGFLGFLQKTGAVVMGVIEAFKTWNGETFTFSKRMTDTLKSIGMFEFVVAVGTYVVRIKEFFSGVAQGFGDVLASFRPLFSAITSAFRPVISAFQSLFPAIDNATSKVSVFREAGRLVANLFGGAFRGVLKGIAQFFTLLGNVLGPVISALGRAARIVYTQLQPAFSSLYKALEPIISAVSSLIGLFFQSSDNMSTIAQVGQFLGYVIGEVLVGTIYALSAGLSFVIETFSFLVSSAVAGVNLIWNAFSGLVKGIMQIPQAFLSVGQMIVTAVGQGLQSAWNGLVKLFLSLIDTLPFGKTLLKFFMGESPEIKVNRENTIDAAARAENRSGVSITADQSLAASSRTAGAAANNPVVISNSSTELQNVSVPVMIDGDVVYEAVKTREELENARA